MAATNNAHILDWDAGTVNYIDNRGVKHKAEHAFSFEPTTNIMGALTINQANGQPMITMNANHGRPGDEEAMASFVASFVHRFWKQVPTYE